MKKLVSILSVVALLVAAGVLVFDQNAFAEEPGIRFILPENLQEVNPGDKVTVSGVVDGVRRLGPENKLSIRVGRHRLPLDSRRNRFTSEFEVSKSSKPRHLYRGVRGHGVIYIFGRVKINNRYYFDRVKVRVKRNYKHRENKKSRDGSSL